MRVIIAIDKFKESLTSFEAASIIQSGLQRVNADIETTIFPMADGGDGFAQVLKFYLNTKTVKVKSVDSLFRNMIGYYEWSDTNNVAIIEMAICSGLATLKAKERNPLFTSSYGTGLLIRHAIKKGAKKIILGLGGSSTNDAGIGIAYALGFSFFDKDGLELMPIGASLINIHHISPPKEIQNVSFEIATDVSNPLFGKNGAAYIYSPQKGAKVTDVEMLDKGLRIISKKIKNTTSIDISKLAGVGAAGGISAMILPFYKARLISGIDYILEVSDFINQIKNCDLLISGEGKIDNQSFQGKVVGTILQYAKSTNLKVLLVAGKIDLLNKKYSNNIQFIELSENVSIKYSIKNAQKLLHKKMVDYFKSNYQ